jgi:hypothetical protein
MVASLTDKAFRGRKVLRITSAIVLAIEIISASGRIAGADSSPLQSLAENSIQQSDQSGCVAPDDSKDNPIHLYIPDGQLRSSPVRIFVNRNISMSDWPSIRLYSGHAFTAEKAPEDFPQQIDYVAPGQSWIENLNGQGFTNA